MAREPNIPLFLWVAVAILTHMTWGGGAYQVATVIEEYRDLKYFAASVRRHVRDHNAPITVALLEEEASDDEEMAPANVDDVEESDQELDPEQLEEAKSDDDTSKTKDPADAPEADAEEPEDLKAEKAEPEKEKKTEEKKPEEQTEEKPVLPKQTLKLPNRIAVEQHVEDENQDPNPDAEFIADHANRVEEQTQATITSTDQNDPNPSAGSQHQGPTNAPGDSHVSELGQSEDSPGEMDRAPHEQSRGELAISDRNTSVQQGSKGDRLGFDAQRAIPMPKNDTNGKPTAGQVARKASSAVEAAPDLMSSDQGTFGVPEPREARAAQRGRQARKKQLPKSRERKVTNFLGLGRKGTTANGINLNLSHRAAVAAIGQDQLSREARADGERRRSQHRGSWKAIGIERWRSAIENYVPMVRAGNQTRLNTAHVPFASYLNRIHNQLHPIFAGDYLMSLDSLPGTHAMNRMDMHANLEIVLSRQDGSLVKMGVTKTSGVTAFDILALEAVHKAAPFGAPPSAIVSPDGNVYFHWEFHRDPRYACSTYFARPYMLKVDPKTAPPKVDPPTPYDPREPPEQDRHGFLHPHHHVPVPAPLGFSSAPAPTLAFLNESATGPSW